MNSTNANRAVPNGATMRRIEPLAWAALVAIALAGCGQKRIGSNAAPYDARAKQVSQLKSTLASMSPDERIKYMQDHAMQMRASLMPAGMGSPRAVPNPQDTAQQGTPP